MDPLEEAKYKDVILRHLKSQRSEYLPIKYIIKFEQLKNISETTIEHLIHEIEKDGYISQNSTLSGITIGYNSKADYFLENDGYEAQFIAEHSEVAKENMKYRKVERQEGFIRFVKVIKSGAWLVGFIISVALNIYFILKFWIRLF